MRSALPALALASVVTLLVAGMARSRIPAPPATIVTASVDDRPLYDPDSDHLWNRIDRHFRLRTGKDGRTYGGNALDPLVWRETRYLLEGESHRRALELLDTFVETDAHRLVTDPVRRVLLQRDLWGVFDWAAAHTEHHAAARHALASRLARVIRRVALTPDESTRIAVRPDLQEQPFDTYLAAVTSGRFPAEYDPNDRARPFLPRRLFDPNGPWVPVHGSAPLPQHSDEMSRSHFGVFLTVPGGRKATLDFLKTLWDSSEPYAIDPSGSIEGEQRTTLRPGLRPVPAGTQIALVRRMLFIDAAGDIRYSSIIESLQIRVFRERIQPPPHQRRLGGHHDQDFYEFMLDRHGLVTNGASALRALGPSEEHFLTFSSHGIDVFERQEFPRANRTLEMCVNCHHEEGLASLRSSQRLFKPYTFVTGTRPVLDGDAAFWKSRRADWGRLQTYWQIEADDRKH